MTEVYGIGFCMGVYSTRFDPITSKQNRGSYLNSICAVRLYSICAVRLYEERSPLKGFVYHHRPRLCLYPQFLPWTLAEDPLSPSKPRICENPRQLCHEHWLRRDIADLMSNSAPLWDGKAWRLDARPRMKLPCTGKQCGMPRRRREICC
jgi:hypothetical protein